MSETHDETPTMVYLIIEQYSAEYEGTWKTVKGILADETDAELRVLELNEAKADKNTEYYVEKHPVLRVDEPLIEEEEQMTP